MYFVDRSVAIIKPKQPFLNWLNNMPESEEMIDLSLDTLRADCTVLLLPEFDEPEEAVSYIDDRFEDIFKMELASWYESESVWPADRSLKAFWEWFDIEIHSMVIDTVDSDIMNTPAEL